MAKNIFLLRQCVSVAKKILFIEKILSQGGYKKMETCYFCHKGILEDKKVTVDFRWGTKLVVIEEVPAKVCNLS